MASGGGGGQVRLSQPQDPLLAPRRPASRASRAAVLAHLTAMLRVRCSTRSRGRSVCGATSGGACRSCSSRATASTAPTARARRMPWISAKRHAPVLLLRVPLCLAGPRGGRVSGHAARTLRRRAAACTAFRRESDPCADVGGRWRLRRLLWPRLLEGRRRRPSRCSRSADGVELLRGAARNQRRNRQLPAPRTAPGQQCGSREPRHAPGQTPWPVP